MSDILRENISVYAKGLTPDAKERYFDKLSFHNDTGYPHDGRADKDSYPHDGRADKDSYPHDGRADKDSYPHDRHNQYIIGNIFLI